MGNIISKIVKKHNCKEIVPHRNEFLREVVHKLNNGVMMCRQDEYLIFGYVHQKENTYNCINVPSGLMYIIALYFVIKDDWDKTLTMKDDNIVITGRIIENIAADTACNWRTVCGQRIVSERGKYEWHYKIVSVSKVMQFNYWKIIIGIIKNEDAKRSLLAKGDPGYVQSDGIIYDYTKPLLVKRDLGYVQIFAFIGCKCKIFRGRNMVTPFSDYGETFEKENDELKMILDLDNLTLSYIINGNQYPSVDTGNKFVLNKQDKYRMIVSISPGRQLELFPN